MTAQHREQAPVEAKVKASTAGSAGGLVASTFLIWLAGVLIWHASADAGDVAAALATVPFPVTALIGLLVTSGATFASGYRTHHTARPEDRAKPPGPVMRPEDGASLR